MAEVLTGMTKAELPSPALVLDLEQMEQNLHRMESFLQGTDCVLRPHTKTHKSPLLAHKQLAAGARGVTCQTLGEAGVMVAAGIGDVFISNQIVGSRSIERLAAMARHAEVKVAVDCANNLQSIAAASASAGAEVGVLVEVNTGMDRCGVAPAPSRQAVELAHAAEQSRGVRFMGLHGYEGHTVFIASLEERKEEVHKALDLLLATRDMLAEEGLESEIITGGGTGTYMITAPYSGIKEIQAGSYLTMDARYEGIEGVGDTFAPAVSVLGTILSRPEKGQAVIDVGRKSVSMDFGLPRAKGLEGIEVYKLSEEHGLLALEGTAESIAVGDRLELVPAHGCTTINLHDSFYGLRNGRLELVIPVLGRGR